MKTIVNLIASITIFFFLAGPSLSQEEIITMKNGEFGTHKRPLVRFPHKKHEDLMDCQRCHHDFDQYKVNNGGDGQRCSECHSPQKDSNPVPLLKAFHLQCKGCHETIKKTENRNLPVMCGQCHTR